MRPTWPWFALICFAWICGVALSGQLDAQETRTPQTGLNELKSPRLLLITDVPLDDELRSWPSVFEQCLEQWQTYYHAPPDLIESLQATVYLIGDNQKFETNGLLAKVPGFQDGYQFGDRLYVREQPSIYYRRHLFIHEANHWIMWKLYGGAGSAWFMEGMADMQSTHSLESGKLTLNVMPSAPQKVPAWGRLKLIDLSLKEGRAPALTEVLAFENMLDDRMNRYAWSWAACLFFTNHPTYGPILAKQYQTQLDYSQALSRRFRAELDDKWQDVLIDWNGFVSDLDFGYDFERSMVISNSATAKEIDGPEEFRLAVDRGWQSTGVRLKSGAKLELNCSGTYRLREKREANTKDWMVESQGVTIEYYRGKPLGCVLATIVPDQGTEQTRRWEETKIGKSGMISASTDGILFLKINEPSPGLRDNSGELIVKISPAAGL